MAARPAVWLACALLAMALGGCDRSGGGRPSASQIASALPQGSTVDEIAYADLTGDGREEVLVAATVQGSDRRRHTAFVLGARGGRYASVLRRPLAGQAWLPIQVGRPGESAAPVAVFASREGQRGQLGFAVALQHANTMQVMLERNNLLSGQVRFVPEGLLESEGDVDRIYRWLGSRWEIQELPNQYLPPLQANAVIIPYRIDEVRGALIDTPRSLPARVGQQVYPRRFGRGDPSRLFFTGATSSYSIGPDRVITLLQPDTLEIHIEGPAYSGRTITILVRIGP
ncbi:MAG TPA: hypothetical protein VFM39_04150 [bacterium]|nr:hypothetical protein [bacterium]